jgi:hypothetical protein
MELIASREEKPKALYLFFILNLGLIAYSSMLFYIFERIVARVKPL